MNILLILANVLNVYVLLLILRIFLTWFPVDPSHLMVRLLYTATDPWLNLFRNLKLVFGGLDLSPMVAIGALAVSFQWGLCWPRSFTRCGPSFRRC